MKKFLLSLLLASALFAQTPTWEAAGTLGTANNALYARSNLIEVRDTLFVISDNNGGGSGSSYLWQYDLTSNAWDNLVNPGFGFSSYPALNPSILFTKNNVLYNYYGVDNYNVYIRGYRANHSTFTSAYAGVDRVYLRPIIVNSLFKDSLMFFTAGYGYSTTYAHLYFNKYDSLSNAWSYQEVPDLYQHDSPYSKDNQVVLGSFYIKDTLYVTTQIDSQDVLINRFPLKIWKRNPVTFAWTNTRSFTSILNNPVIQQKNDSTVYFLLSGRKDSTGRVWNEGVWKFDGDTWTRYTHPVDTTFYTSLYVSDYNEIFAGTSSRYSSDQNYIWRYTYGAWQNGGRIEYSTGLYLGNGNIIRYGDYVFVTPLFDQYGLYSRTYIEQGGDRVYRTDGFDALRVTSPVLAGEVYYEGQTYHLGYTSTHVCTTTVSYSTDGGANWNVQGTDIAVAGANIYDYTIPAIQSNNFYLKITATSLLGGTIADSSKRFETLGSKQITITDVSPTSGVTGDTIDISISTTNLDSVKFYYSTSSSFTTQTYIGKMGIDNILNTIIDTVYRWALTFRVMGSLYIKAEEDRDTTIYTYSTIPLHNLGSRTGAGNGYICQTNTNSGTFLESFTLYDPSCGWSTPAHTYITSEIKGDGAGFNISKTSAAFNWPYTSATFTKYADIDVAGEDYSPAGLYFYNNIGTSIIVDGRLYYIIASGINHYLMCNDLINNVDGILVSDISPYYANYYNLTFGTSFLNATAIMMEYNINIDSLITNAPYASIIDWETLNAPTFKKAIIVGNTSGYLNTYYFLPLPFPNSSVPLVYDTYGAGGGESPIVIHSNRNFFRGIDPKIIKRH